MIGKIVWSIFAIVFLLLAAFLYWSLPSREIVRVLGTDVVRQQVAVTNDQGQEVTRSRDIRFINAVTPEGAPRVYRNEDTGWGWPPYFKHDTANLGALAQDAISGEEDPEWFVVTSYGWRLTWFSTFPNAVSIRPAVGPDETLIPWVNIVVWALFVALVGYLGLRLRRFFAARAAA